ncbi:MAG: alpha-ketoacid dehydrogenase subunit beta [Acidimicrobiales bacterium]|jgi:pyruvate dehydrogenase E1 component beta subunit
MTSVTYRQAVARALADEMEADDSVLLFGEDVGAAGGVFKATEGLQERFGPRRVLDTPISEQAIVGCAIGAAARGLKPVIEIMFADFAGVCFDQIANELAKYRYMTNGQVSVGVTVRMANGAGGGFGAQHSQSVENWFLNIPGLKIVAPSTPADAYSLLREAIRDPNPVLYLEHKHLYNITGPLEGHDPATIGQAKLVRDGSDLTLVASQLMLHRALETAAVLAEQGISAEVIDPRTMVPFDLETVANSVVKTKRLLCVQECSFGGSWGATMIAALVGSRFEDFDAPPLIVGGDETPIPFAADLEAAWLPSPERILEAARLTMAY